MANMQAKHTAHSRRAGRVRQHHEAARAKAAKLDREYNREIWEALYPRVEAAPKRRVGVRVAGSVSFKPIRVKPSMPKGKVRFVAWPEKLAVPWLTEKGLKTHHPKAIVIAKPFGGLRRPRA